MNSVAPIHYSLEPRIEFPAATVCVPCRTNPLSTVGGILNLATRGSVSHEGKHTMLAFFGGMVVILRVLERRASTTFLK